MQASIKLSTSPGVRARINSKSMFAALKKFFSRGATTSESASVPPPQPQVPSQRSTTISSRTASSPVAPHMGSAVSASPPATHEAPPRVASPSAGNAGYKFAPVPSASPGTGVPRAPIAPIAPVSTGAGMASPNPPASGGETVSLPLSELLKSFPELIQAGVLRKPSADTLISLPLSLVLPQVSTGAIKLPFGQFRVVCPEGTFPNSNALDQTMVTLPLALILPRINPAFLARRSSQRRIVDPESFESVFARGGQPGSSLAPSAAIGMQEKPVEAPLPNAPATQPHVANPFTPVAASDPAPIPMSTHLPFAKAAPLPNAPITPLRASAPSVQAVRLPGTLPTPSEQAKLAESLWIPLHLLSAHLPSNVQILLADNAFATSNVGIPVSELEAGLKQGRLVFTWNQLRNWIEPTPPAGGVAEDSLVPLPLQFIVPLFLAKRSAGKEGSHKKVVLDQNIPDVFGSVATDKRAATDVPASPAASELPIVETPSQIPQAPARAAVALKEEVPAKAAGMENLGAIFGQPDKATWTPLEIVRNTARLPGMVGSLISLQDGLLVSGQVPGGINAETVAAFIPQVFGRMAHYTRELKFGEPSYVGLVVSEYSLHIFKTGSVYFMAMGRAGEQPPLKQLNEIALQIERQSKTN